MPSEKAISRGDRYVGDLLRHRGNWQDAGCFVDYDASANFGKKHRVACGLWVFVAVASDWSRSSPDGSKSVLKLGSQVSGVVEMLKRGFGRQTSSRWRFSRKNDWVVQVIPQQAISDKGHIRVLSTRNSKSEKQ
jgi:hypothetical protein